MAGANKYVIIIEVFRIANEFEFIGDDKYATRRSQMLSRKNRGAKEIIADKIANDVAEIFKTKLSSVSVTIKDISEDEWKEKVWDVNIVPDDEFLYKKPGYTCD